METGIKAQPTTEWLDLDRLAVEPAAPVRRMMFMILWDAVQTGAKEVRVVPEPDKTILTYTMADGVICKPPLARSLHDAMVRVSQVLAQLPLNTRTGTIRVKCCGKHVEIALTVSPGDGADQLLFEIGTPAEIKTEET